MRTPTAGRIATTCVAALASLGLAAPAIAAPAVRPAPNDEVSRARSIQQASNQAAGQYRTHKNPKKADPVKAGLDQALAKVVADGAIGITAQVVSPGLRWAGSAGLRDKDATARAGSNDRFRGASNTKMMVATLVLQQVEKGTWTLDTRANEVIPGLLPGHDDVTLRGLLSHTSGMPYGTTETLMAQISDPNSTDEFLAAISRDHTPAEQVRYLLEGGTWTRPGEFVYSNTGYVVLGMLLEARTGRSLDSLMREHIWKPTKMNDTYLAHDPGMRGRSLHEDSWFGAQWLELDTFDPDFFGAAGSVVTTADDLNRFTRALVTGRLVDRSLLDEMMRPLSSSPMQYGLGLYRIGDPCDPMRTHYLYGHDGASFGTLSVAFTSEDGTRQVSLGASGRDVSAVPGRWNVNDALVPMLLATCPAS